MRRLPQFFRQIPISRLPSSGWLVTAGAFGGTEQPTPAHTSAANLSEPALPFARDRRRIDGCFHLRRQTGRWHLHTCDDDLDLGRAAVDEEFDAVDET
jgi:hypothetical protein